MIRNSHSEIYTYSQITKAI